MIWTKPSLKHHPRLNSSNQQPWSEQLEDDNIILILHHAAAAAAQPPPPAAARQKQQQPLSSAYVDWTELFFEWHHRWCRHINTGGNGTVLGDQNNQTGNKRAFDWAGLFKYKYTSDLLFHLHDEKTLWWWPIQCTSKAIQVLLTGGNIRQHINSFLSCPPLGFLYIQSQKGKASQSLVNSWSPREEPRQYSTST